MPFDYSLRRTQRRCPECQGRMYALTTDCSMRDGHCPSHPNFEICEDCLHVEHVGVGTVSKKIDKDPSAT